MEQKRNNNGRREECQGRSDRTSLVLTDPTQLCRSNARYQRREEAVILYPNVNDSGIGRTLTLQWMRNVGATIEE